MHVETCRTKGQTYECFLSICNANNFGVKTLEVSAFRPDSVFTRNFNWGTLGCENWVLVFVWQGYELGWQALILGALNSHFWSLDHVFYTLWVVKSSLWKCWRPSLNSPNFPKFAGERSPVLAACSFRRHPATLGPADESRHLAPNETMPGKLGHT